MGSIRFIHTADVHLGRIPQIGGASLPDQLREQVHGATFASFSRLCDLALAEGVDFVVIAGDLYDGEARTVSALEFFVRQCERLYEAGIGVYVLAGNHDPLREREALFRLPPNVFTFPSSKPEVFEVKDDQGAPIARVVGQSYERSAERRRLHQDYPSLPLDLWNIGVLHTQLEGEPSTYLPCSVSELREKSGYHYWALGHIHQPGILHNARPHIAYPGTPQGKHVNELERGGCLLVELNDQGEDGITHVPLAPIVYKRVTLKIDEDPVSIPETLPELEERMAAAAQELLSEGGDDAYPILGYIVQWNIEGRGTIHTLLAEQQDEAHDSLLAGLRGRFADDKPFVWTERIMFRTKPELDLDELLKGSPVVEELDRVVQRCQTEEELQKQLKRELGQIWSGHGDEEGYQDKDDFVFYLDDETLQDLLADARQLILEKLAEGRE
jgi:DNA repair exonuclease SbcCD nuclease subunit